MSFFFLQVFIAINFLLITALAILLCCISIFIGLKIFFDLSFDFFNSRLVYWIHRRLFYMLLQQWIVYFNMLDDLLFNSRRLEVARNTLRLEHWQNQGLTTHSQGGSVQSRWKNLNQQHFMTISQKHKQTSAELNSFFVLK